MEQVEDFTRRENPGGSLFVNPEVPIESLPAAELVEWRPLDARYLPRVLVGRLFVWLTVIGAAAAAQVLATHFGSPWWTHWTLVAPAWAALCALASRSLLWPFVSVPRCGYAVRDRDILHRTGVLWRRVQVVPFNRVQHAVTSHGPLDRRFGLATLVVFTAGGSAGDMAVAGLGEDVAERLRAHIVGKLRGATEAERVASG